MIKYAKVLYAIQTQVSQTNGTNMTQDVQYIHQLVQCINQALYNLLYNRNIVMYTCILTAK
jgi:hypothetical protein